MKELINLGMQPLANGLTATRELSLASTRHPLAVLLDEDTKLLRLGNEVDKEVLYGGSYHYRSGVSQPFIDHCRRMCRSLDHLAADVVMDIGGNDGTLLRSFLQQKEATGNRNKISRMINVDAGDFAQENNAHGIEYHRGFFSPDMELPKAKIITSTNVFQHTRDITTFIDGICKFIDGVWVLEFPYAMDMLKTLQFDQVYHEHYYYWLLTPLESMFRERGLKIIHIERHAIHGGTLRLWMTNSETSAPAVSLSAWKEREARFDYSSFGSRVSSFLEETRSDILSMPGRTVFFGAAAKGCVFLNALGLNINEMPDSYVIDDTPSKQGLYVPGTGFEVVTRDVGLNDHVDTIIVLAHNFMDHIRSSLRADGFTCSIKAFLPVSVVDGS